MFNLPNGEIASKVMISVSYIIYEFNENNNYIFTDKHFCQSVLVNQILFIYNY